MTTELPQLFYRTESIQRGIFLSNGNIFAILTFRQGQIPNFNSLDETRSSFSNVLSCTLAVRVITLFHLAKNYKKLAITSHSGYVLAALNQGQKFASSPMSSNPYFQIK